MRLKDFLSRIVFVTTLVLLACAVSPAQNDLGTIRGGIMDPSGAEVDQGKRCH